ncbi:MAG: helix-turn-helix transcriptional regulator [Oscillospiraceae bacterium]|nr:helix-turn-helix transcriptional regulator [Oscillospiraceae bacterium]
MSHPHPPFSRENPMFFMNIPKLRGAMAEKGYNKATFAAALGIGRDTLTKYMNDPRKIPYGVLQDMAHLLFRGKPEAMTVFMDWDLKQHGLED